MRCLCDLSHAVLEIKRKKRYSQGRSLSLFICLESEASMCPWERGMKIQVPLNLWRFKPLRERLRTEGLVLWYQLPRRCYSSGVCLALQGLTLMGHNVFPDVSFSAPRWAGSFQGSYCLWTEMAQDMLFHLHYCIYAEIAQDGWAVYGRWDTCQGRIIWDLLALGPTSPLCTIQHSTELHHCIKGRWVQRRSH